MILSSHSNIAYIFLIHSTRKMLSQQTQKFEKQGIAVYFVSKSFIKSFREYKRLPSVICVYLISINVEYIQGRGKLGQ